ncbi:unnamed protein product [Effrenium voratum]|nr:unnamed protein product [Effrenium voratum]
MPCWSRQERTSAGPDGHDEGGNAAPICLPSGAEDHHGPRRLASAAQSDEMEILAASELLLKFDAHLASAHHSFSRFIAASREYVKSKSTALQMLRDAVTKDRCEQGSPGPVAPLKLLAKTINRMDRDQLAVKRTINDAWSDAVVSLARVADVLVDGGLLMHYLRIASLTVNATVPASAKSVAKALELLQAPLDAALQHEAGGFLLQVKRAFTMSSVLLNAMHDHFVDAPDDDLADIVSSWRKLEATALELDADLRGNLRRELLMNVLQRKVSEEATSMAARFPLAARCKSGEEALWDVDTDGSPLLLREEGRVLRCDPSGHLSAGAQKEPLQARSAFSLIGVLRSGLSLAVAVFVLFAWARVLLLRAKLARAPKPVAPSLLAKDLVDDVVREEELVVVLSCYRETQEELKHSLGTVGFQGTSADVASESSSSRSEESSAAEVGPATRLMIFLDGLQGKEEQVLQLLKGSLQGPDFEGSTQAPSSSGSGSQSRASSPRSEEASPLAKMEVDFGSDFDTLQAMIGLLPLRNPERVHGCVRVQGELSTSGRDVPFELYIKTSCARSKRASQALCMSLLSSGSDLESGRSAGPQALLLLDGDCRVKALHVPELFRCLRQQKLAACGPFMLAEKRTSFCLLVQLVRDWASQRVLWLGQSLFRFQAPLNGSCALYSMEAVQAIQDHFCRAVREDSMMDNMRIEMGEDSFMTNLVHEHVQEKLHGVHGIRFMPQCHASSFMPETWLEYLAQQCRWKRSHLGNRSALLLNPKVWCCSPGRWPFWLVHVASFLWTPHLAPATLTLWFAHLAGEALEDAGLANGAAAGVHAALWLAICVYAVLSRGSVPSKPKMHTAFTGFFMILGALQMFLLAHRKSGFGVASLLSN